MAADRTFFRALASVDPRTHAPVLAIVAQGVVAAVIALSERYDQILNYVTCVDYMFFGLSALALIIFRNRDARDPRRRKPFFRMPGHPWTTLLFAADRVGDRRRRAGEIAGRHVDRTGHLLTGLPAYAVFARYNTRRDEAA